jgi:choline-glycine betaine transporter
MDKMDRDEKLWGGIFGIIAIVAAIAEIFINGVNAASIVGAVKDITGTLVVVVLLVAFVKSLPKKPKNFREQFESDMSEIEQAYAPLIVKYIPKDTAKESAKAKNEKTIRYDILSSVDALFGKEQADHLRLFELNAEKPEKMCFYVREKFFGKPFDA